MPTDSQVDKALELIQKSGGNYQYFFEKLTSPTWIEPLAKRGRFAHPPFIERVGDLYRFPRWPEGDYLLRMAPIAPDAVSSAIADGAFASDNPLIHQLLIEIGSQLPGPQAASIARRETRWLDTQVSLFTLYPERAAAFVEHLCANHEARAALDLTATMLEVRAPADRKGVIIEGDDGSSREWKPTPDPLGKMEPVWSQLFLRRAIAPLAQSLPAELLLSLAQNLNRALVIRAKNQQDTSNDYSDIWRPHLEHGSHPDTLSETVSALIEAIKVVLTNAPAGLGLVLTSLEGFNWPIFNRIRAFAFLNASNALQPELEGFVSDATHYDRPSINPEFSQLLTKAGPTLTPGVLDEILKRIDAGPDPESYAYHLEHRVKPEDRDLVRTQIVEQWQRDWLFPLSSVLDGPRAEALRALVAKYDAPRRRFRSGGAVQVQDHSPTDIAGFNAMDVPELIQYLKDWIPPSTGLPFEQPSRAGMAGTLRDWVVEDPARAIANLQLFFTTELDPVYITTILDAFAAMLKSEQTFDVYAVAHAVQWVAENTDALAEKSGGDSFREATWNWAQMSAARYMTDLLLQEKRLEITRAAELWPAVRAVCYLARPTVEDEAEYKKEPSRHASYALNTPRPVGVEAMIRYGRWMKLATPEKEFSVDLLAPVFEVLEEKVDPAKDPSAAVREMFGMQFRVLAWLDLTWFMSIIPKLFPGKSAKSKDERVLDRFAWSSYLQYGGMAYETLPAMRDRYLMAINALAQEEDSVTDAGRTIGNHLTQFYAHGAIELDDPLLVAFFQHAKSKLRAQMIGDIGWGLGQESEPLGEVVQTRLMQLLESRLHILEPGSTGDANELATFGWWLSSDKFPEEWAVAVAMRILEATKALRPDFAVVEALDKMAPRHPYEAVRVVRVLLEEDKDGWAIHGWDQHLDSILRQALDAGDPSRTEALALVELLVARGFRGYRNLIAASGTTQAQG